MNEILAVQKDLPRATRILDPTAMRIFGCAQYATGLAVGLYGDPARRGLYLYLATTINPTTFVHEPIGIVDPARAQRYMDLSKEKPERAAMFGHTTSYTSRDRNLDRFGGGVVVSGWKLGCSGFPDEQWDETVVVITAVLSGQGDIHWALEISQENNNAHIPSMLTTLNLRP